MKTQNISKKTKSRYSREVAYQPFFCAKLCINVKEKIGLHVPYFVEVMVTKKSKILYHISTWIGVFLLQQFSLFGQALETCCHLMQNPSLDACN